MRNLVFASVAVLTGCGSDGDPTGGGPGRAERGTVLAESEELVLELGVDGEHVYWVSDQMLRRLPVNGGEPAEVGAADGETLALSETDAYFVGGIRGTVTRLSKDGGSPVTIVTGQKQPTSIGVDASGLYFANWSSYLDAPVADGSIFRADLDGANVAPLAEGLVYPRGFALDSDSVYFVSATDETLYRLSKAGGTPIALATGLYDPGTPVLDESGVYVRTRGRYEDPNAEDAIVRVDREGGDAEVVVSERLGIDEIGVYAGFVYYTRSGGSASCERRSGVVRRVATTGGAARDVVVEQSDPALLVVNATGVYFTNGSGSSHACKNLVKAELP